MESVEIKIERNGSYRTVCPISYGEDVQTTNSNESLSEYAQHTINKLCGSRCGTWEIRKLPGIPANMDFSMARVCNEDAFFAILCPYNTSSDHYMYIWYSINSGDTWFLYIHHNNNNNTYINKIKDVIAFRVMDSYNILCAGSGDVDSDINNRIYMLNVNINSLVCNAYIPMFEYGDGEHTIDNIRQLVKTKCGIFLLNGFDENGHSEGAFWYMNFGEVEYNDSYFLNYTNMNTMCANYIISNNMMMGYIEACNALVIIYNNGNSATSFGYCVLTGDFYNDSPSIKTARSSFITIKDITQQSIITCFNSFILLDSGMPQSDTRRIKVMRLGQQLTYDIIIGISQSDVPKCVFGNKYNVFIVYQDDMVQVGADLIATNVNPPDEYYDGRTITLQSLGIVDFIDCRLSDNSVAVGIVKDKNDETKYYVVKTISSSLW